MTDAITFSRPYAEAAYKVAVNDNTIDIWLQDMDILGKAVKDSRVKALLASPKIKKLDKIGFLTSLTNNKNEHLESFLSVLIDNKKVLKVLQDDKKDKDIKKIKKGDVVCKWGPYNGVIISEFGGKVEYENIEQGITYQVEIDEQTGFREKVISESRNKKLIPTLLINDKKGKNIRTYNLPVALCFLPRKGFVFTGTKKKSNSLVIPKPKACT